MNTDWAKLQEPFPASDIEWRVQSSGEKNGKPWARVLAYVTARAIQARLDEVFGPGGWKNEYRAGPDGGVLCRIYFRNDEGEWVWREDGAENTDVEAVKGGISGALKRAGAALGIGRYLYELEEGYANIHPGGKHYTKPKTGDAFKWDPPALPAWALPKKKVEQKRESAAAAEHADDPPEVAYINSVWGSIPEDATMPQHGKKPVNLRSFIKAHREAIRTQEPVRKAVVARVEEVTKTAHKREEG